MNVSGWTPAVWQGGPASGPLSCTVLTSPLSYPQPRLREHSTGPAQMWKSSFNKTAMTRQKIFLQSYAPFGLAWWLGGWFPPLWWFSRFPVVHEWWPTLSGSEQRSQLLSGNHRDSCWRIQFRLMKQNRVSWNGQILRYKDSATRFWWAVGGKVWLTWLWKTRRFCFSKEYIYQIASWSVTVTVQFSQGPTSRNSFYWAHTSFLYARYRQW